MKSERPKTAVFAYGEVGYSCLEELISGGANVTAVFTHSDNADEGRWFQSVGELARSHGIFVRTDAELREETAALLRSLGIELILSFFYRAMLPSGILAVPRLGSYNMHGSLLPKYRGRACINWAIVNGERATGVTLHEMTEYADSGDIVDSETVPIGPEETAFALTLKIAGAARVVISRSISAIESGTPPKTPQDGTKATKFGRRTPSDGLIDWNAKTEDIYNLIRAVTHPFPGAFSVIGGKKTFIWRARPAFDEIAERYGRGKPGSVVCERPFLIAAGDGLLEVLSWQPDGELERSLEI
jgi:methionyl-tRNA formyltransferase